ncbi:MAG: S-adenosyl-l-methionine hydroxide adenosyltransferase family protein, partial [Candidatus Binatia bacterium]
YVGAMKGVILSLCRRARLVDLGHEIAPGDLLQAALALEAAVPCFPPGTVHCAVVDPGVGSNRSGIVLVDERGVLVGPDNGLLSLAAKRFCKCYRIEEADLMGEKVSSTFHGRDVFAPVVGHLASGVAAEEFGPEVEVFERLELPRVELRGTLVEGEVIHEDRFGNLTTNIEAEAIGIKDPSRTTVEIAGKRIETLRKAYCEVERGALVVLEGSLGRIEIAVRDGSAAERLGLESPRGTPVYLRRT